MQRSEYDTVTRVPVLVPGNLLPKEWEVGTDTFRINFQRVRMLFRIGHPRPSETLKWTDEPVARLESSDLDPKSSRGRIIWDAVGPAVQAELIQIILLRDALGRGAPSEEIRRLYRNLEGRIFGETGADRPWPKWGVDLMRKKFGPHFEPTTDLQDFIESCFKTGRHPTVISGVITQELDGARIVFWWTGSKYTPAVWCEDLKTAIYLLSLPVFAGHALAVCPRCQQMFVQSRPGQTYDSVRCREAHRVARWRKMQQKANTQTHRPNRNASQAKPKKTRQMKSKRRINS